MGGKRGRRKGAAPGLPRFSMWAGRLRAWWPAILAVALIAASDSGADVAATAFFVTVMAFACLFGYWRRRLARADIHLPLGDVTLQVWRAWFLLQAWPRACHQAKLGRDYRSVAPRLGRFRLHDDGTITSIVRTGRYGVAYEQIRDKAGQLAQFVGAHELEVRDIRGVAPSGGSRLVRAWRAYSRRSGVVELRFFFDDALGRVMRLRQLPLSQEGTVCIGRKVDRQPAVIRDDQSVLIIGATGSGKSNDVWVFLADQIRKSIPLRLYVSDPKGGMELRELGEQVGKGTPMFEVREYATTPRQTTAMFERIDKAMACRQRQMAERKQRKHVPTLDDPRVLVISDEGLALREELKAGADGPFGRIGYQGRAAGYLHVLLSQDPVKDVMGPVRDLIPQRLIHRLRSPSAMTAALGYSAPGEELNAPGIGFLDREGETGLTKFRAPLVTDAEVAMIARGRVPEMPGEEVHDPHRIYRYWGVLPVEEFPEIGGVERLLYLGKVRDSADRSFADRDREHRRDAWWYQYVTRSDASEQWPSKRTVEKAEKAAIEAEGPVCNTQHNLRNPFRRRKSPAARDRVAA